MPIMVSRKGVKSMQIEVKIDNSCTEPKVMILTASVTEEVKTLLNRLSEQSPQIMAGSRGDQVEVLKQAELIRVYASGGKVFAVTDKGEYTLRLRMYEVEERLSAQQFVRISNSEIISLKKVECFDLSFTGTICVKIIERYGHICFQTLHPEAQENVGDMR